MPAATGKRRSSSSAVPGMAGADVRGRGLVARLYAAMRSLRSFAANIDLRVEMAPTDVGGYGMIGGNKKAPDCSGAWERQRRENAYAFS